MNHSPAIEVLDLHRSFGENKAVQGVSFDVQQGEIFSLLHLKTAWRKFPEGRLL